VTDEQGKGPAEESRGRELGDSEAAAELRKALSDVMERGIREGLARGRAKGPATERFDLIAHLLRQREWSERTFGPALRTRGVLNHIRKELAEIERSPFDLSEWVDVVLLAFDGAWRAGHEPEDIARALAAQQARNEARTWPDWRDKPEDESIEHDRTAERHVDMVPALWREVERRAVVDPHLAALVSMRNALGAEHALLAAILTLSELVARMTEADLYRLRNEPARRVAP